MANDSPPAATTGPCECGTCAPAKRFSPCVDMAARSTVWRSVPMDYSSPRPVATGPCESGTVPPGRKEVRHDVEIESDRGSLDPAPDRTPKQVDKLTLTFFPEPEVLRQYTGLSS